MTTIEPLPASDLFARRWVIEFRECGIWDTLDEADDEETAHQLASHYGQFHRDENLRISTPDNRLL